MAVDSLRRQRRPSGWVGDNVGGGCEHGCSFQIRLGLDWNDDPEFHLTD